MVDETFPVLFLPYLAICNVLDHFNLNELIHFSFCSKRTQRIASRKPKGKVEIILKAQKQSEFIVSLNKQPSYKFKPTPIADVVVPTKTGLSYYGYFPVITVTLRTEAVQGIDKVGTYITALLKTPITEIQFLSEKKDNDTIGIIDSVKRRQTSIEKCTFGQMKYTDRYLSHLLSTLEITDDFDLAAMTSDFFRYSWSLSCVRLTVQHGEWLTVEHLLNMNCQIVDLQDTKIRSEDLNQFLKHWQSGGCSSLKYLRLRAARFDMTDITEGIQVEEFPDTVSRSYLGYYGETIEISGGHGIKRNDGTIGTVFFKYFFLFEVRLEKIHV
ncbi:unnamed protein product [Caenorhabditis brenneri]